MAVHSPPPSPTISTTPLFRLVYNMPSLLILSENLGLASSATPRRHELFSPIVNSSDLATSSIVAQLTVVTDSISDAVSSKSIILPPPDGNIGDDIVSIDVGIDMASVVIGDSVGIIPNLIRSSLFHTKSRNVYSYVLK